MTTNKTQKAQEFTNYMKKEQKAQYTGGTWKYIPDYDAVCVVKDHKLKCLADFGRVDIEEKEANARLIAASPALLEACEYTAKRISEYVKNPISLNDVGMIHQMLYAAIAKAKGE